MKQYTLTEEDLRARDAQSQALGAKYALDRVNVVLPELRRKYAQAGADAITRHYEQQGLLLPVGRPFEIKTVNRDERGQITAIVTETVIAHEVTHTPAKANDAA